MYRLFCEHRHVCGALITPQRISYHARLETPIETSTDLLTNICAISQPKQSTVWKAAELEGEAVQRHLHDEGC